jgi:hypothetical protein
MVRLPAATTAAKRLMRLLYFSPVHAGSYAQRPHFMVRALLDLGIDSVLWVNPYPCRLPRWQDMRRPGRGSDQGTQLDPRIHVLNVPALPIEPLPLGPWLNRRLLGGNAWRTIEHFAGGVDTPACREEHGTLGRQERLPHHFEECELVIGVGRPCALALTALRRLNPTASFFDAMDNFPEFYRGLSRRSMRRCEDAVAAEVDLVVASSTFLADKFIARGLHVEKVLNAFEETDRAGEQETDSPADASSFVFSVSTSRGETAPILGYLGCIGRWFDWPLVIQLAEAMPQARIELVGPCAVEPPGQLPANVTLLPACPQAEAGKHLARFSAGLIPFRSNALTAGVDPIKYYDYRAAGLPVLSTRFGEMASRDGDDGVYFLDETGGYAEAAVAALTHRCDPVETRQFRRNNTWTARFRRSDALRPLLPALRIRHAA